jgi:hypothetical protein
VIPSTINERTSANRENFRAEQKRLLARAVTHLTQSEDFQFYMAHLLWGVLGLEKDDRGSDVARHRRNTAAAILGELTAIDHLGTRLIVETHLDVLGEEIEVLRETVKENPNG